MENRTYYTILYDYYQKLFTENHQKYFEDYYFNNLSLAEISENVGISRNAIHKRIKNMEQKLDHYEGCLGLYEKGKKLSNIISAISDKNIIDKINELEY